MSDLQLVLLISYLLVSLYIAISIHKSLSKKVLETTSDLPFFIGITWGLWVIPWVVHMVIGRFFGSRDEA